MTTYDRTALTNEALANLFADGGAGQSADSEDVAFVDSRIDALLAELNERSIVSISDPDDIEPAYFLALGELLAEFCGPKFGRPRNRDLRLDAEDRLKVMVNNGPPINTVLKVEPALRPRLPGLSLARWTAGG